MSLIIRLEVGSRLPHLHRGSIPCGIIISKDNVLKVSVSIFHGILENNTILIFVNHVSFSLNFLSSA